MHVIFEDEVLNFKNISTIDVKLKIAEDVLNFLKKKKVIIYGAGAVGTALLHSVKENHISPYFFVDRRYEEVKKLDAVPVNCADKLSEISGDEAVVIVAVTAEVIRGFNKPVFENIERYNSGIYVIKDGADITTILNFNLCYNKLKNKEKFNIVSCLNCGAEHVGCDVYNAYLRTIAIGRKIFSEKPSKNFDWFGYIMGQNCTLKCKHCCEQVPYMKNPAFINSDTIISDCKKIAESCEFLRYIELVGGEPFLHPNFVSILENLLNIENVGYIKVFTNGTIVPNDKLCEVLHNSRMVVNLSNYTEQAKGLLLDNIYKTREKLDMFHIDYIYSESKTWTDWGGFEIRNKNEEELKRDFEDCFISNCHRLHEGILYRCPHQYAGIKLGKMSYIENEYIDINQLSHIELSKALDRFEALEYTDGCRRCDMPYNCLEVPAAIQL